MNAPAALDLPGLLLPYQQELLRATASSQVTLCEKSRRIGMTWGTAADAVLTAGAERSEGGQNVLYMGYEREMTREFIDTCAFWAKSLLDAIVEIGEFLFKDQDEKGVDRDIQAFRIEFASGFKIVALCSRPRALRGKQGFVILDEAAFHDDLEEVIKAALALLIWGGKLLIISTHDGAENAFNRLVLDIRAGKLPYHLLRVTFDDAIEQGLYKRICLTQGKTWTADGERAWAAQVRAQFPGDSASEELDCVPRNSGGKYLSRVLLEARGEEVPILQWSMANGFVDQSDEQRQAECKEWCEEHLAPVLSKLKGAGKAFIGQDFARNGDLSVIWVYLLEQNLRRRCALLVELRNIPFREQEQVLGFVGDGLTLGGAALDARGNGQYLAERARQKWGAALVREVMLSGPWYAEHWPRYKAALEDDKATIPASADVVDDFRTVEVVRGVPIIVERTGSGANKRHGDAAIGGLLAYFASEEIEVGDVETFGGTEQAGALQAFGGKEFDQRYPGDMYA